MKLLRHSDRRGAAVLEAAIRLAALGGDFRVLNDLERVVTEHASDDDSSLVAYPVSSRTAAASAIGRIIEADRSAPPGRPNDGTGDAITADDVAAALAALEVASCPGEDAGLRAAALESIGMLRTRDAVSFLESVAADPKTGDDEGRQLLLQGVALRSLTNILHNNHLANTEVLAELRALVQAYDAESGVSP